MKLSFASIIAAQTLAWTASTAYGAKPNIRGVPSDKQHLYKSNKNNKWSCLSNPEIELDASKINDDYCDCPDGSDEPGTSACSNGRFFCENAGFRSSYIPSFKVNDGVCDYEICCDGSDEWNTDANCPNRCKELNKKYESSKKEKLSRLNKGLLIKQKLLKSVEQQDAKLQKLINDESVQVSKLNDEVYELKSKLDELNLKYNKEAMLFLNDLKEKHQVSKIDESIYGLLENIDLIKLGVDRNEEKVQLAHQILRDLANDFDQSINDVAVKENIKAYQDIEKDERYNDYEDLFSKYRKEYDATVADLKLYNTNFWLEHNKEHLANWKNFIWTRKTTLHTALLRLLLIQDEIEKKLEALLTNLKENYNPNFNDNTVKTALKSIEKYNDLKKEVQDEVLSKIDYVSQYENAFKELVAQFDTLEGQLGRSPSPVQDLRIDDEKPEHELSKLRSEKQQQIANEEATGTKESFLEKLHKNYAQIVEDFLGINDNVPEKSDPLFESTPFDLVLNKLDQINDLSNGQGSANAGGELKDIRESIASKQQQISELNSHVAELVAELQDTRNYYGPDKILKAIEEETYRASIGEYEYSINFLGSIKQVGNGQDVLVGKYAGSANQVNTSKDGTKIELLFDHGAKCWSGPIRQAKVSVFCGSKVEILKVTEPEICQYVIDVTSPIACFESDLQAAKENDKVGGSGYVHDEL